MKQDLTAFLSESPAGLRILLVESTVYLPKVRALFPQAAIDVVTDIPEVKDTVEYRGLADSWHGLDYRRESLPFEEKMFDIILAAPCLSDGFETYRFLLSLNRLLRETGFLLSSFSNVRYHAVLDFLKTGHFPTNDERFFAKADIVSLLERALYKEIHFLPGDHDEDPAEAEVWQALDFSDFSHDLSTRVWLFKAMRSSSEAANLKSLYDGETRAEIGRLLRRIEYGIQIEKSLAALKTVIERKQIFPEYILDFAGCACHHAERVKKELRRIL